MTVKKFEPIDTQAPELKGIRNDLLSTANKLDAFSVKSPWPDWIKSYSEMLRKLSRDICEKD